MRVRGGVFLGNFWLISTSVPPECAGLFPKAVAPGLPAAAGSELPWLCILAAPDSIRLTGMKKNVMALNGIFTITKDLKCPAESICLFVCLFV